MLQVSERLSLEGILADWEHGIKPVVMKEWGEENKEELVELFGKVRDDWIENDIHGWIGANRCNIQHPWNCTDFVGLKWFVIV